MWSIERPLFCRRCGKLLGFLPSNASTEYVTAVIKDFDRCPRCNRKLEPSQKEYHHEMYFHLKSIMWKITHPWRLFK